MKVLSFGGGVQTTALAILVAQGKVNADIAIFADTGGERPETYWYLENYTRPLLKSAGIDLLTIKQTLPSCQPDLYGWLWKHKQIPSVAGIRLCSIKFKREWQWLKVNHPDLFQKALELEVNYHKNKPQFRDTFGIYRGLPLRHIAEGQQYSMGLTLERSCWSGACGH